MKLEKIHQGAVIKTAAFLIFIITAVVVVRFTSVRTLITAQHVSAVLETAGLWAPLIYIQTN